jgi:hypothetical protein
VRSLSVAIRLALPLAGVLASAAASAAPAYAVILASGVRLAATSRPLLAMGKVSFLDESRRPVTLPTSDVDVEATRAALGSTSSPTQVWDAKSLTKVAHGVQFYGEKVETVIAPDGTEVVPESANVKPEDQTQAEHLRTEIEDLNSKIRVLPTSDRTRSMLVIHQLELQEELSRVLSRPADRG